VIEDIESEIDRSPDRDPIYGAINESYGAPQDSVHATNDVAEKTGLPDTRAESAVARTQPITPNDITRRQIRLPKVAKKFFPSRRCDVQVELKGELFRARYNPRIGPHKQWSATLVFKANIARVVRADEVLAVGRGPGGIASLT